MFGAIKMRLGMVEVTSSPKFITVEGISTLALLKDIQRVWGSSQIAKYMFSGVRSGQLKILHFFGLDFLYICQTLYADSQSRTPRRVLKKVMEELKANTWIGDIDRNVKSITDMSIVDTIVPFPLKPFQREFAEHFGTMVPTYRLKGYMLDAGAGTGKAQPLSAKIKVPGGWKAMGDMVVGDEIIAADGSVSKVTGVFPQGRKDIYTVTFSDERQTECCLDHLWEIHDGQRRKHLAKSIMTTKDIIDIMESREHRDHRLYVPLITPEDAPAKDLPMDPYTLGALIGDGCFHHAALGFSTPDQFVLDELKKALPESLHVTYTEGDAYDYRIVRKEEYRDIRHPYLAVFRDLGMANYRSYEKFIPEAYLNGSIEQRLHLLQGLMDTDGYIDVNSSVSYTTTSERLIQDVEYLVRSLGGVATTSARFTHYPYNGEIRTGRLAFTTTIRYKKPTELFRLPRKKERANDDNQYAATLKLRIKRVEKTRAALAQCISIDHPEQLYVTNEFIVTHNTVSDLVIGECLHANKVVIVSPKNAIERVWEDTIKDILIHKRKYWISGGNVAPSLDDHYFICHYESLENLLGFIKANPREFKGTFVILDESHNFNRIASDRTQFFIELCKLPQVDYCLWASGTPIQALGIECIPFLRCVDPMFNDDAEERFRKIYGRDAKRANDILRNRIGHLKYHVPKQDVVTTEVTVTQIKVQMPGSEQYTLEAIGEKMRAFIAERNAYYAKNYKSYADRYYAGLKEFEQHLRTDAEKRAYITYTAAIKLISSGFDPKTMKAESQLCNQYEQKTIIPLLPNAMKPEFKSAKSVVKYVALKVMGEALSRVVGSMRSQCNIEMLDHIDFSKLIDGAAKKTLIFTSYVEALERAAAIIKEAGYSPLMVYGATNKDLASIVKRFFTDEDLNPLLATFQSLSTAVPLTVANNIIMLNQPFRDAIRIQTIARAARLGQDEDVTVWDVYLDTGDKPNISTRSGDILEWSAAQVAMIMGIENVDLDSMTLVE